MGTIITLGHVLQIQSLEEASKNINMDIYPDQRKQSRDFMKWID